MNYLDRYEAQVLMSRLKGKHDYSQSHSCACCEARTNRVDSCCTACLVSQLSDIIGSHNAVEFNLAVRKLAAIEEDIEGQLGA